MSETQRFERKREEYQLKKFGDLFESAYPLLYEKMFKELRDDIVPQISLDRLIEKLLNKISVYYRAVVDNYVHRGGENPFNDEFINVVDLMKIHLLKNEYLHSFADIVETTLLEQYNKIQNNLDKKRVRLDNVADISSFQKKRGES